MYTTNNNNSHNLFIKKMKKKGTKKIGLVRIPVAK